MTDAELADFIIRSAISVVMVAFGLHQIINPKQWQAYLPPWLHRLVMAPVTFLQLVGLVNLSLGIAFGLIIWPDLMTWAVLAWWLGTLPFAFHAKWDIGMRDLAIVCSLVALLVLP